MADLIENRRSGRDRLSQVTAPPAEPVSLTTFKAHAQIDHDDDDTEVAIYLAAARGNIDGPDGWLGRALVQQTWDMKLDGFPLGAATPHIQIPLAPLISVDSITYRDTDGDTQTLASSVYQVVDGGSLKSFIALEPSQSWPGTDARHDSVTVRFTAGYAPSEDSPPDYGANVPGPIKAAILLEAADMYRNRETRVIGNSVVELPTARRLLMPYRASWW
ncbi:hypothetical protein [Maricaulis sp.]|uniref:head-tail connector protein n=1 Tax=Maricaulis sp. TaxID=1486257 RepID=UPI000C67BE90|nr:hypothetical protein [Maricaulis sp.]MAC89660.1 hypothetical protein [Maricaulis sp.]